MAFIYLSERNRSFEEFLDVCAQANARRADILLDLLEQFISSEGKSGAYLRGDDARGAYVVPSAHRLSSIGGYALLIFVENGAVIEVQPWEDEELLARWNEVLLRIEQRLGL